MPAMSTDSLSARTLDRLTVGETAVVDRLTHVETVRVRLMQMGLWPGESVTVFHRAPLGGPLQIDVMGYRLAIRRSDARQVFLR